MGSKVIRNVTKILKATSGRLFGRVTAGDGRAEELTASDVRTLLSVSTTAQTATLLADKADLVGGVVPTAQIPAIAITEYLGSVASQVAMQALVGDRGDWCLRSDLGTTWVLSDDDSTLLASWTQLLYPTAPVTSVAGRTGAVTLANTDISGLGTLATQSGTFSGTSSGTNTGDNAVNSLYVTNATHTGDVTGATALTIAADAVTYAKMQNISVTDRLLGRSTLGTGDVEEIICTAAGRALLDDADIAAQRTTLGLGTLATQSGTFSGTSSGTNTGDQNLSSYLTSATAATTYQPVDADLTAIAGLIPANDDFLQRKAGAWTFRTVAQAKTDLGLTGSNSGDQTITLTGNVTGSGTGSFATTIGAGVVSNSMLAGSITLSKLVITGVADGTKFLRDDGSWQVIAGVATGISSLNALAGSTQTFAVASTGTDFGISSSGTIHTFSIPDASATARGVINTGVQSIAGAKTFTGAISASNLSGTNSGDQTISLTGDVTGTGTGSFAATIAADAVTYAKIQNVSVTDRLLGRSALGAGDVEEIICTAAGRALLDDADIAAQRTTLGLGTLATQSGTFSGTSSGTNTGDQSLAAYLTSATAATTYASLTGTYANPAWITSLIWTKLTSVPAAVTALSGTNTGDQNLSSYLTSATAATTYQPVDADLTAIAALIPTNDDFVQRKAGVWTNRTVSQAKTDLGLSGTNSGDQDLSSYLTSATSASTYVSLSGTYTNPSWIVSIPNTKVTGLGTLSTQSGTFSGTSSGTNTGDQDLSGYATTSAVAIGYQSLDADLTAIAGLIPANDDFVQRKAGVWTNRTVAQAKTDLGLTGSNSGDQTITLTGNVTGTGTGSFATTIGAGVVTDAMLAGSIALSKLVITGVADGTKFLRDDGSWQVTAGGGTGIASLNGLTGATQTFTVAATGTDFGISSSGTIHTFAIPDASATARGLVTTGIQTFAGAKTFSGAISASNLSGTNTGDQNLSSYLTSATAASTYVSLAGTYTDPAWIVSIPNTKVTGLGTLATQSGTFSGTSSGTNTGDQSLAAYLTSATAETSYVALAGSYADPAWITSLAWTKLSSVPAAVTALSGTNTGDQNLSSYLTSATAATTYVSLAGSYTNPAWIVSIPNTKVTGLGTLSTQNGTFSGTSSGTNTGDQDLSGYATTSSVSSGYQPLDGDLTSIAGLSPANDDFIQRKAGVWANRTVAQVKTDLSLAGTNSGDQDLSGYLTSATAATTYVALAGTYTDPAWIVSIPNTKVTGLGTLATQSGTFSGTSSGTNTGDQSLAAYATTAAVAAGYQPLDADLTAIAGLAATNDDFVQRKAGAWINRTVAQVKTDLSLTGTNSGDQTITLTGDVTGTGTGSFAATIAADSVTYAKMQNVSVTDRLLGRSTLGTGDVEEIACTAAGRALIDDADTTAQRTTLGLGTLATQSGTFSGTSSGTNTGDNAVNSLYSGFVSNVAHTGEVTGSTALTIATAAVTLAKMADVATGTLFYRKTALAGAPEVQTLATLKTDLALTGTNTGDQTITLTGDVTGTGAGSFAATIGTATVTLAKMANVATGTIFYRKTTATGAPEVQPLGTLKTDLGLTGTNSGDQTITLTGNVTGTGTGSFATTIAALAVTNAMLAGSIALSKLTITGVADGTKFLRDDGSWQVPAGGGTGLASLNGLTGSSQTFAVASTGTDFAITSAIGVHTFSIPDASATARGLITTGVQTIAGAKTFSGIATVQGGMFLEAGTSYVSNYASGAQVRMRRAQGTQSAPTQTIAGANLGIFGAMGYKDIGGWSSGWCGYISFIAAEAITGGGNGGYFTFYTTPIGSTAEVMRVWCGAGGNFGIGTFAAEPTTKLTINGDMLRLTTAKTPASESAAANQGEVCWDADNVYVAPATNTWKKVPLIALNVGTTPHPVFVNSRYYSSYGTTPSTQLLTTNTLYYVPFVVPETWSPNRIGINVTNAVSSTIARMGIYNDVDGVPAGAPLLDAGTVDTASVATREVTLATPQLLPAGIYWLAVAVSGAVTLSSESIVATSARTPNLGSLTVTGANVVFMTQTHASAAALPTVGTLTAQNSLKPPRIWLRLV